MKIKSCVFLSVLTFISLFSYAQDNYVRPSVSIINLDFPGEPSLLNLNDVTVPANLDHIDLSVNRFNTTANKPNKNDNEKSLADKRDAVLESFISNRISNAAIMSVTPVLDGEYDYRSVLDRGVNSATDQDVNITSQNMLGDLGNEQDQFLYIAEQILDRNYMIAFNKGPVRPFSNDYSVGFEGDIRFYIFKINSIYSPDNGDMIISAQDLPEARINAEIVSLGVFSWNATNSREKLLGENKSDSELKKELTESLLGFVWEAALMNVDDFQPKTTLLAKRKISLGTKENLKIDNRFFAFENVESKDGKIIQKKKSTLRVKRVGNNDGKATGDGPKSKLYKIGYGSAKEGMLIQQKEDLGIGVAVGYGSLSWLRLDYRIKGVTPGLLGFIDVHPYPGAVEFHDGVLPGATTSFAINSYVGAEKMMYFSPIFYLSPFVGIGISKVILSGYPYTLTDLEWSSDDGSIYDAYLVDGGVRAGFHLTSSLSANYSIAYIAPIIGGWNDPAIVNSNGDIIEYGVGGYYEETDQLILEDLFTNILLKEKPVIPNGMQFSIMLRYEF